MSNESMMSVSDADWADIERRNPDRDGDFVYGVTTTGIFCNPSCPSRQALRAHTVVFADADSAREAGFRACKRCLPGSPALEAGAVSAVEKACALIEAREDMPSLTDLAAAVGLSRHHFHRVFKSCTGITPRAYAAEVRARRLRGEMMSASSVTDAAYGAGYGASSRFYEDAATRLGMAPSDYRKGGAGQTIRFALAETTLGTLLVAATRRGICAIEFGDDPSELLNRFEERFPAADLVGGDRAFEKMVADVCGHVERPQGRLALPLDIEGTVFQQRVWAALQEIPVGQTRSYSEVAAAIGAPSSTRAVASACARNKIAVAIPCHRVVRSDGTLSGYRWGVDRKARLLDREADAGS